ncbi:Glucose-6-phosphatase 2 [Bulinus truncatus]|nr:Glucose-6-phosphatase 2 [Bulinus truncatus]
MFDSLHLWGVLLIQELQLRFQTFTGLMLFLSHLGDPKMAFNLYFPIAYFLHYSIGKRVLWVAILSEWLNSVLKWLFHGERPYWWVHESGLYRDHEPVLKQFNITCETGPGSPSGHAMVTSAVWYVLISDYLYYNQIKSSSMKFLCWAGYLVIMCGICLSRIFIATHFPHQVIGGVLAGLLLGKLMNTISTSSLHVHHYIFVSTLLTISATFTYMLVGYLGIDPFWSLTSASKWCSVKEWVHLDTTLFYCIIRDISSLLGLGISVSIYISKGTTRQTSTVKIVQLISAVLVIILVEMVKFSPENVAMYYITCFLKHSILTFFIAAGIPFLFNLMLHSSSFTRPL